MAKTVQDMVKEVEKQNLAQTAARSVANPNQVTTGGTVGYLPDGTPIQNQAMTYNTQPTQPVTPTTPTTPAPVKTTTPTNPANATGNTNPTSGEIYKGLLPSGNAELDAAYNAQGELIKKTQEPIDEASIRENTLRKFQSQIDAVNQYYADVKAQRMNAEEDLNRARLGSGAAIQARRGLLGSDFGNAQTDQINANSAKVREQISRQVDSERAAEVQALLGRAQAQADQEIQNKLAAQTKGAQDYITFLEGAASRKDERVNSAIANIVGSGLQLDDTALGTLAQQLGTDLPSLKTRLQSSQASIEKKRKEEEAKNAAKPVEVGGVLYERQTDGSYKAVTPKAEEKPLVVGGAAYVKQGDGTYKMVTQKEEPKPINRVVNKVLQVSLDNGKTWAPAQQAGSNKPVSTVSGKPVVKSSSTTKVKPVTSAKMVDQALNEMQLGIADGAFYNENGNQIRVGGDGKVSPQDYLTLRNAWVKKGLNPTTFDTKMKGYRNPDNTYYAVGK